MVGRELGPGSHGQGVVGAARVRRMGRAGAAVDAPTAVTSPATTRSRSAGGSPSGVRSERRAGSGCCSRRRRSPRTARPSRSSGTSVPIVTGGHAWCQLFSEPGAGSDLAGLGSRAIKDGEEWVVNGQKVWTSGGHIADMGMLIARTNPEAPKHQGISWFAMDMKQAQHVEVRPLREMTGRALFNEVFLDDARVGDDAVDRWAEQRLGGREHDARVRARRPRRRRLGCGGDSRTPARSPVTSTSAPVTSSAPAGREPVAQREWPQGRRSCSSTSPGATARSPTRTSVSS